jgi:hypothetical protein
MVEAGQRLGDGCVLILGQRVGVGGDEHARR